MCVYIVIACLDCPAKDPGTTETKHYDVNTELDKTRTMLRKRDEAGNPWMVLFGDQTRASKKNRASLRSGMMPVGAELNNLHKGERLDDGYCIHMFSRRVLRGMLLRSTHRSTMVLWRSKIAI